MVYCFVDIIGKITRKETFRCKNNHEQKQKPPVQRQRHYEVQIYLSALKTQSLSPQTAHRATSAAIELRHAAAAGPSIAHSG